MRVIRLKGYTFQFSVFSLQKTEGAPTLRVGAPSVSQSLKP